MGLPSLGVNYVASYGFTHHQREGFCILQVSVSKCIDCYSTTIDKDFLLWIVAWLPPMRQKYSRLKWVFQV